MKILLGELPCSLRSIDLPHPLKPFHDLKLVGYYFDGMTFYKAHIMTDSLVHDLQR
jgi:hypothetical protein